LFSHNEFLLLRYIHCTIIYIYFGFSHFDLYYLYSNTRLVFMALGCMVFGIGLYGSAQNTKMNAKRNFWMINIWIIIFIPLSFVYNILFTGSTAPYPLLSNPLIAFPIFWLVYFTISLTVVFTQIKINRRK